VAAGRTDGGTALVVLETTLVLVDRRETGTLFDDEPFLSAGLGLELRITGTGREAASAVVVRTGVTAYQTAAVLLVTGRAPAAGQLTSGVDRLNALIGKTSGHVQVAATAVTAALELLRFSTPVTTAVAQSALPVADATA